MGATNNIKERFHSHHLIARNCADCGRNFTSADLQEDNWEIEYRTNASLGWQYFKEGQSRGWIELEIELKHSICPRNE